MTDSEICQNSDAEEEERDEENLEKPDYQDGIHIQVIKRKCPDIDRGPKTDGQRSAQCTHPTNCEARLHPGYIYI